jgi:hypothetical protein
MAAGRFSFRIELLVAARLFMATPGELKIA